MKKILFALITLVFSISINASDKFYLGGNIGLWYNVTEEMVTTTISPDFGINLSGNTSVGVKLGFSYSGPEIEEDLGFRTSSNVCVYEINPYLRWNFFKSGVVNLFADFGGGAGFIIAATHVKYYHGTDSGYDTYAEYNFGISPGVAVNLSKKFSIVAHLGFLGYKGCNKKAEGLGYKSGIGFDFSNSLSFGFYYNF